MTADEAVNGDPTAAARAGRKARILDVLWYAMWATALIIGLTGFVAGLMAGPGLYLLALVVIGILWWPFVKIGGFFFFTIEMLEVPPVAVAVVPWLALIVAALMAG